MSGESIGRWFIGIGFVWVVVVLTAGLLGGLDKPSEWVGFLADVSGWRVIWHAYLFLTFVVVPIGMLLYVKDVLTDPVALWVKCATPGAMAAVYVLFLAAARPDLGRGALLAVEGIVPAVAGYGTGVEATGGWFVRFLAWLGVLAGVPAVVGRVIGLFVGDGRPRFRP
jgi:hypothetical protein